MWSGKDTARALRGEKVTILQQWHGDVKTRLRHLDGLLVARKGGCVRAAQATMAALIEFHMGIDEDPAASGAHDAALHPVFEPSSPFEDNTDAEPPQDAVASALCANHGALACATDWDALDMVWPDVRTALLLLADQAAAGLARRGAPCASVHLSRGFLVSILETAADRRLARQEEQVAIERDHEASAQHLTGRFLANASHELRTPLTAVLGFSDLLLEDTYGELNADQREAVTHIENSAQNLLEIVNNLLDLLHIRTGKLEPKYRRVEVVPLLTNIYDILMPLSTRKEVAFVLDLPENLGFIDADANIVRHIVYHLLASALRATPKNGLVTLSASRTDADLLIMTRDTALNIPPEAMNTMMDPFPRIENSPARGYEGWEVGLPLVNRYIELHGGTLTMTCEPPQGTLFTIALPVQRQPVRPD